MISTQKTVTMFTSTVELIDNYQYVDSQIQSIDTTDGTSNAIYLI